MLIPCIDLQGGRAVQLVRGRKRELAVDDVFAQLAKFRRYPWLHIIDLDAAMGKGDNRALIGELCKEARRKYAMKVRIGGGVRAIARARQLCNLGATQIIIGSAVFRQGRLNLRFLRALKRSVPRRKIVIALDTHKGKITTHGWRKSIGLQPARVMAALEPFCAAFLCTDVDNEGTLSGANLKYFAALRKATTKPIIAAGGIRTRAEIEQLARLNMDGAVGMALYKNLLQ